MTGRQRRSYGSGSITQRKDGYWIGRIEAGWTPQGTRRRITVSAKTEAECKRRLKDRQREIAKNGMPTAGTTHATVKSWADGWLPLHAQKVRPTTYTTDAGTVRKWIVPTVGHRRLAEITPADLRAIRDAIISSGRTSTTAAHAHRVFRKMLRDAIIEGHAIPPRILEVEAPKKAASDRTAIPIDQALRILAVAGQRHDSARWVVGILQGMRQGEALGLTWDAVDLDTGTIDVSWQLQRLPTNHAVPDGWEARHLTGNLWLTRPKTLAGKRRIPLVAGTTASLKAARVEWTPNPWGLVWTDRGQPVRKERDLATFHAIQAEAGVAHPTGRPWHGHEMRHTAISLLVTLGVDRSYIEQIVGQSKLVESYITPDDAQVRAMLERAAAVLQIGQG